LVITATGQEITLRVESNCPDAVAVSLQSVDAFTRLDIPEPDQALIAAATAGESTTIWAEGY
jgi:hypothetical protein